jgi:predicted GH43/DUF377 family glycosyl hydrolase
MFIKFSGNPILSPENVHDWEDEAVFNPGVTLFNNKFIMLYRAIGEYDKYISVVGKAESTDGFNFIRQEEPAIIPKEKYEEFGVEDLRINRVENKYYLTYTVLNCPAKDGGEPHQVGLIKTEDFKSFERLGIITPKEFCSRNGVLFSEKINEKYAMLHRPLYLARSKHPEDAGLPKEPGIWISYSNDLIHWEDHKLLLGPKFWWETLKIGGGAPPLKTEKGWLVIYHGVEDARPANPVYRAGLLLLDLNDPGKILYQSKEPVLEAQLGYEIIGDAPNVVFPTGLVEKEGVLYLYYGAADKTICLATAQKEELLRKII